MPGPGEHVYRDGGSTGLSSTGWGRSTVQIATFGDVIDRVPASGRAYLPTASYREMGEWALAPGAGRELERASASSIAPTTAGGWPATPRRLLAQLPRQVPRGRGIY